MTQGLVLRRSIKSNCAISWHAPSISEPIYDQGTSNEDFIEGYVEEDYPFYDYDQFIIDYNDGNY